MNDMENNENSSESTEFVVESTETSTEIIPAEFTEVLSLVNLETNVTNISNLGVGILIALGLLIGVQFGMIFLNKIWR